MAEAIPASLRQADITRFINRANQLRSVKPAVTYWCEYWVVNQILAKQLHNTDDDSLAYTMNLMDQLEKTKTERPDDEAIMDDAVGQAVVEQFAQQTFGRAERVMNANKVTRQTADTFDAAATFFQLLNIWGQPDAETQKKIKFARWNAARILKAVREGNDPNESNPAVEQPEAEVALPSLDPNDPDVQLLTGNDSSASAPRAATVEDDPDAEFYKQQSAAPSAANVPIPRSPNEVELPPSAGPGVQTPGGYFPPTQARPASVLSEASGNEGPSLPDVPLAPAQRPDPSSNVPSFRFSRIVSPPPDLPRSPPREPSPPAPPSAPYQAPPPPAQPSPPPPAAPAQYQPPPSVRSVVPPPVYRAPVSAPAPLPVENLPVEHDVPGATKHARFAISALNFEDVPTAVKELRAALAALGARP
ncbi:Vacuolar protein sorting-associated protein vts1 like [Verticillium longisporum]|uniref:Vacuolar protein sorting-associated protein vts1 like n=1 Tax=Verticillium longisporum TaxID=100787 RepID=A0A8I3APR8_VERLO|nr:Vacuolar protein sorting-associated protein vts1 like [Verticillium longisporum]KAG7133957.1 Vacuolar protein sorting-associated protein vts1 like [Verticillium longisporum]